MTLWIIIAAVFYALFIYTWVKGLGIVKEYHPEGVVKFYFLAASIRFVMALTIVTLYMIFSKHSQAEAVVYCTSFSLMYVLAIVVSVVIRH